MKAKVFLFVTFLNLSLLIAHFVLLYFYRDNVVWIPKEDSLSRNPTKLNEQQRKFIKELPKHPDVFDSDLGWVKEIRSSREHKIKKEPGVFRVACFGGSYVRGSEVSTQNAWASLLDKEKDLECINFGVGGYGTDQAYLRYKKEGIPYQSDLVIIGFMTHHIKRHVSIYRPFLTKKVGIGCTKPRFTWKEGNFSFIPNPYSSIDQYAKMLTNEREALMALGEKDYHYRSRYFVLPPIFKNKVYNTETEAFMVTCHILDLFYKEVQANNSHPLIVIFPSTGTILDYYKKNRKVPHQPLLEYLDKKKYRYLDLLATFESVSQKKFRSPTGQHYNELGNQVVAKELIRWLNTNKDQLR